MIGGLASVRRIWAGVIVAGGLAVFGTGALGQSPAPDSGLSATPDDIMRLLEEADAAAKAENANDPAKNFLLPIPDIRIEDMDYERFLTTGIQPVGVAVRNDPLMPDDKKPYYEGTFKRIHHVYYGRDVATFDKGVYAVPGKAAYVGNFEYFPMDSAFAGPTGSFVLVGKKLTPDGTAETGLYLAETVYAGMSLNFIRATPQYLDDFQRRHGQAVEAYKRRKEQEAAQARAQASSGGGFGFGQMLALGLGAAMIGVSDLPSADKLQLGSAFVSDVLGDTGGSAMASAVSNMTGASSSGAGSLFSGGTSFSTPGLNGMLQSASGGNAGGVSGPAQSAAASQPASKSERFSFSCPSGASSSMTITYRTASCASAAKNYARVYGCNMINDFGSAQRQCQQACGNAQCVQ